MIFGYRDAVLTSLNSLHQKVNYIMAALDDLTSQVSNNTTTVDSALALINGIADRITAAGTDSTKLKALTSALKSSDDALAAAVVANTPAAGGGATGATGGATGATGGSTGATAATGATGPAMARPVGM